jgi:hypothetical protein
MTHSGVGALTAIASVLIIGKADRFSCGKQIASYLGLSRRKIPAESDADWDTSANRTTPCYVSCWWKLQRSRYAVMRNGAKGFST